ncbi:type I secretion system permease/ATPase [Methylobacter svalbardensis]|uniref:type I secretion system permease/ATPase n=1 Tax=Methylobacter svalbardensis TaxID=3080016 RepID=UPI0030EE99F5
MYSEELINNVQANVVDSLLACLLVVCRIHGVAITKDALTAGLPLVEGCMTPTLVKRAAVRANLASNVLKKPLDAIRSEFMPCILLLKNKEACLLLDWDADKGNASVIFPELGDAEVKVPAQELAERYAGYVIVAKPKFTFDRRAPAVGKVHLKHWFWGTLAENTSIYRDIMLAAFLINMFALAMPIFTMNVYDRILPNRSVETLWVLVIGVVLIVCADFILRTMRGYFLDWASQRVDIKLSGRIMEQVLGTRLEQRPSSVGSFASNLRSFETVRDFITSATITTLVDIPFALIFIGVMAWIDWPMVIPVVAGAIIMLVYSFSVQTKMHELSETLFRAGAMRNATLIESLVGLETIKALGIEGHMQRKWEKSASYLTEVSGKLKLLSSSITNGANGIQQTVNVVLVLLGVYLVIEGDLTMGGLIACTMLAGRALAPIAQSAGLMTQYHNASTSLTSLEEIMNKPVERPEDSNFLSRPAFAGDIEFREVCFTYPGTDVNALKNVSFKVKAGEHVAILGRMGSGKTTLHKLILGLYRPTSGAILIDGIDSRQIDPAELRRSIGYVQQDTNLFFGSMRDNITIATPHAEDSQVLQAAKIAGIDEFINMHPKGFDMTVGERGETLSGGQRQGVGIARAMINNPAIILLDEPTSAMDHSGEELVKNHLIEASDGKTLMVITHRSSLFDLVNRIIVIDVGKVVADGNKEQVIEALRTGKIGKSL